MSTRQFPGCTEVLGVSTTLFKNKTIRDRTSPALPQSASSDGLRFSSEPIPNKSIEGFKKPFSICQSAIQIIKKRGFPKSSRSDCSQGIETGRLVIKSTPWSNSLRAPAEKEPQPYASPLFHTSSIDEQSCSPQNHRHRRVSFVLPGTHRDTRRYFDEPSYRSAERMKRQADVDAKSNGGSPSRHECTGSDDKPPSRRLNRFTYTNNEINYR